MPQKLPFKEQLHDVLRMDYLIYNPDHGFIAHTGRSFNLTVDITMATSFTSFEDAQHVIATLPAGIREHAIVRKVHRSVRLYGEVK